MHHFFHFTTAEVNGDTVSMLGMATTGLTEGVGFEPTVGFPTLDFESSALNRTQPPFLTGEENVER